MDETEFEVKRAFPPLLRVALGVAGALCIAIATWQLRHAILQPGWWTLFFGIMLLGAWAVGGSFLWAALLGEEQLWRFAKGELIIQRRSALRRVQTRIDRADVARTHVAEIVWDSRPPTFNVVLHLRNGRRFETADMSRATAEALEARIRRALNL